MSHKRLKIIGIHEFVDLPKAQLEGLESKIDSGAYNSAIDCSFVQEIKDENNQPILRYTLLHPSHPMYTGKVYRTRKFKRKEVRSSNGTVSYRYQIKLRISVLGESYKTTFNLSNRTEMRYPVLLGRKFLSKRFLIDVAVNRKLSK
ncbi:MAG: ATP-dependent zinc protease [Bacteroidia bacterium]